VRASSLCSRLSDFWPTSAVSDVMFACTRNFLKCVLNRLRNVGLREARKTERDWVRLRRRRRGKRQGTGVRCSDRSRTVQAFVHGESTLVAGIGSQPWGGRGAGVEVLALQEGG